MNKYKNIFRTNRLNIHAGAVPHISGCVLRKVCYTRGKSNRLQRRPHGDRNSKDRFPPGPGPHGRGYGRRLPAGVRGAGGRADLHRAGQRQGPVLPGQKEPPAPHALSGGKALRRPDLRQRHPLHGGGGPDCHRGQRGGYSGHQHGLSRGEGGVLRRRMRPDAGPGEGRAAGGGGGEGVPRAGDGENAPGLGQGKRQRRGAGEAAGGGRRQRRGRPRPGCRCTAAPPTGPPSGR